MDDLTPPTHVKASDERPELSNHWQCLMTLVAETLMAKEIERNELEKTMSRVGRQDESRRKEDQLAD